MMFIPDIKPRVYISMLSNVETSGIMLRKSQVLEILELIKETTVDVTYRLRNTQNSEVITVTMNRYEFITVPEFVITMRQ